MIIPLIAEGVLFVMLVLMCLGIIMCCCLVAVILFFTIGIIVKSVQGAKGWEMIPLLVSWFVHIR